jgi:L-alanine-DL-glutamate epimerase-like enolase superfamily enzyme
MHITNIETFVVGNPPPHYGGRYFLFVKLTSNDNIIGYGEAYSAAFDPHLTAKLIEDLGARYLLNRDPHDTENLFRLCYGSGFSQRPDPTVMGCFSALEMACWDIVGKAAGKPVHKLIGGRVHERLRVYTYLYPHFEDEKTASVYPSELSGKNVYNDPDMAAECALNWVNQGMTGLKFDPAGPYTAFDGHQPRLIDIDLSARMVKAVREAVGTRADILFGTHGQFTPSGAARMARALEPYDPLWFEEPVPPDAPEAMAEIARKTSIPIAAGERLTTLWDFGRLLATGGASIVQPNSGRSGGILQTRKIAALAEYHHASLAPHCYCGPIVAAANAQIAAASPNFLILEAIRHFDSFHAEILVKPMIVEDGHLLLPDAPGLGVELNEAVARAHPYKGTMLHLEMNNVPLAIR